MLALPALTVTMNARMIVTIMVWCCVMTEQDKLRELLERGALDELHMELTRRGYGVRTMAPEGTLLAQAYPGGMSQATMQVLYEASHMPSPLNQPWESRMDEKKDALFSMIEGTIWETFGLGIIK